MPRKTGRLVLWAAAVVVALGIIRLTPVFGASASLASNPRRRFQVWRGSNTRQPAGNGNSLDSNAFETWRAGVADANIPPEALQVVALTTWRVP